LIGFGGINSLEANLCTVNLYGITINNAGDANEVGGNGWIEPEDDNDD
jgi:hypothetical protein